MLGDHRSDGGVLYLLTVRRDISITKWFCVSLLFSVRKGGCFHKVFWNLHCQLKTNDSVENSSNIFFFKLQSSVSVYLINRTNKVNETVVKLIFIIPPSQGHLGCIKP